MSVAALIWTRKNGVEDCTVKKSVLSSWSSSLKMMHVIVFLQPTARMRPIQMLQAISNVIPNIYRILNHFS